MSTLRIPQMARIDRHQRVSKSSPSVWPLKRQDGLTWAQARELEGQKHD